MSSLHLPKCRSYAPQNRYWIMIVATKMPELRSSEQVLDHDCCYQNAGATLLRTGIESYSNLPKCRSYAPQDIFYVFATSTKMSELRSSGHLLCRCYIYQNTGATLLGTSFMSSLHLPKCRSYAPQDIFYVFATSTKMPELRSSEHLLCLRYIYQNAGATLLRTSFMSSLHLPKCRSYAPRNIFYVFATSTKMSELCSWEHFLCRCYIYHNVGATLLRTSFMSLLRLPKCRSYAPQNIFYVFATSTKIPELRSSESFLCLCYIYQNVGAVLLGREWLL